MSHTLSRYSLYYYLLFVYEVMLPYSTLYLSTYLSNLLAMTSYFTLLGWLVLAWRHLGITKYRTVPNSHSIHPYSFPFPCPEFGNPADNNA